MVVYAYNAKDLFSVLKQFVSCCYCTSCCADVIKENYSLFINWSEEMKFRIDPCSGKALNSGFIEFYIQPPGNFFADVGREMVLSEVSALRCGDNAPFIVRLYH